MGISSGTGAVGFMPVGVVVPFAGSTSPAGWQLCYGQAISRTTYAGLFATIGTTYGSGDGSTTFNLPDLRGRAPHGVDNMGGSAASRVTSTSGITGTTLGAVGGDERVQTHTHVQDAHGHNIQRSNSAATSVGADASALYRPQQSTGASYVDTQSTTATNQNYGAGSSQNMPPTIMLNYIIKAA